MSIAIGQSSKGRASSTSSQATTGVATSATGSVIVAGMIFQNTFTSVTDNKSNTPYVQLSVERTFNVPFSGKGRFYYFPNAAGGAAHTVTGAISGGVTAITMLMAEITGADTSSPLDSGATSVIDAASPYTASITPTAGNRLMVAFLAGDSGSNPATHAESSGFTILSSAEETNGASFWEGCLAYKIVAADGVTAYTVSFTDSGAANCAVYLAAFIESSTGVGARLSSPRTRTGPYMFRKPTLAYVNATSANLSLAIDVNGAITLAGQSATFNLGLSQSTQGAITIAGQSVTPALTIPVSNGAITFAGQSVTFGRNLALATNGAIAIAGQSVTPALTVPVTNGAVTLAGQSAAFALGAAVSNGAITFNGQTAALDLAGNLSISIDAAGQITIAGQAVTLDAPQAQTTVDQVSGGIWFEYESLRARRKRERDRQRERDEETQEIQADLDRSIAEILREQERKDEERDEMSRLQALADRYAGQGMKAGLSRDASAALLKAHEERSRNALEQLQRLIDRQLEEEEVAIVSLLLLDE